MMKTLARKRATLKRVGWRECIWKYWNLAILRFTPIDSVAKKHEDGLIIRYFRAARFSTPQVFNEMGIETFDVALSLQGNVAIDIGAHVGAYALRLARNFRFVYAFEPNPPTFKILQDNIRNNHIQNIEAERLAVSDRSEVKTMRAATRFMPATTIADDHYAWIPFDVKVGVQTVSLDDYFKNGVGKIDFVKIDAENHELAVLKGMTRIIEKHRPVMSVEVHQRPTTLTSCNCNVCQWLKQQGLAVELHGRYTPEMEAHWVIVK